MHPVGDRFWQLEVDIDDSIDSIAYTYRVQRGDGTVEREEWGTPHRLTIAPGTGRVIVNDHWQEIPADRPLYTQAFTHSINRREPSADAAPAARQGTLLIGIEVPSVAPDETVVLAGSCDALGNWDVDRAPEMSDALFPDWRTGIDLHTLPHRVEYKAVVVRKADRTVVRWEDGDNRVLDTRDYNPSDAIVVAGLRFRGALQLWRGAGVAIPVFSLRSNDDMGIGDFYDLKLMIDWAAATGQRFVQILPINDTTMTGTWSDSYPYNATSTFALHPIYLRPDAVGVLDDPDRMAYYRERARELNALPAIEYEKAFQLKMEYLREIFTLQGHRDLESDSFKAFMQRNRHWLRPFAAFSVLRDLHHTPDFRWWNDDSTYRDGIADRLERECPDAMNLVYFTQYHLDKQLHEVRDYAHSHRVAIKGDIPIGISRTSVDAWQHPELFYLDSQAGAPPDDFSVLGQNWGFPTYNWDVMSRDGYAWWKARFSKMAEYFDAYRIDHVLGFFRIWQIPTDAVHGLLGHFSPAMPLSPDEMLDRFGFSFDRELYTRPYITDTLIDSLAGDLSRDIRELYLDPVGNGLYRPKPEVATQRRVLETVGCLPDPAMRETISNVLMVLLDQVLFVEDPVARGKYHPRISADKTTIYKTLDDEQRRRFDALYEDFYYHRHNDFWRDSAMSKLPPLIEATGMLTCAEDLGMIPQCVPDVLDRLKIITLDVQRMPKEFGRRFGNPLAYPYMTVCTTSTHDMSGIREWWEENRELTETFYTDVLHRDGKAPWFATPEICEQIIGMHLDSTAILSILPLQDWLSIDGRLRRDNPLEERINIPANSRHYWRYRMHLTLEELIDSTDFNRHLSELIARAGR